MSGYELDRIFQLINPPVCLCQNQEGQLKKRPTFLAFPPKTSRIPGSIPIIEPYNFSSWIYNTKLKILKQKKLLMVASGLFETIGKGKILQNHIIMTY